MDAWISVKERYPDTNRKVLAWHKYDKKILMMCYFSESEYGYWSYGGYNPGKGSITHWTELPDPPENYKGQKMYRVIVEGMHSAEDQEKLIALAGRDNDNGGCLLSTGERDASWDYPRLDRAIEVFSKFCKHGKKLWRIRLERE